MELELTYFRSTKKRHVYVDDRKEAPVSSLYVNKSAFEGDAPQCIKVTVAAADE